MKRKLRRTALFYSAFFILLKIHRLLEGGGFDAVKREILLPWKSRNRPLDNRSELIADIEWAIDTACDWQWKRCVCLHRSVTAYHLIRQWRGRPQFIMAVKARPFISHAWTENEKVPVGDTDMDDSRYMYREILRMPEANKA